MSLWYVANFYFGERIPVYDGFGFDGNNYAHMARHFWGLVHGHQLDLYHIQRIFPSFIVHTLSSIFGYSLTLPINVIHTFFVLNVFMISVGMYIFYRIAKLYQWNFNITLLGFSALFLNVPILKMVSYCPVWTDYTAFSLGILMLYFYLRNNIYGLIIATLLGAFTFPTMLFTGTLLLLFPKKSENEAKEKYLAEVSFRLNHCFLIGLLLSLLIVCCASRAHINLLTSPPAMISLVGLFSYFGLFLYFLMMILPFIREHTLIKASKGRLCLGVTFFCLIWWAHFHLSDKTASFTTIVFLKRILWETTTYPLIYLVAHFAYYGPFVLLIVIYWKKLVACAYEKGTGLFLVLLMYGILSLSSESRCYINALPVFVFLTCEVLKESNITQRFTYGMLTLSLLMSKFWLPMNIGGPWPSIYGTPPGDYSSFPYQMYFMNFGPWVGWKMYVAELITMIAVFFGLSQTRQPLLAKFRQLKNVAICYWTQKHKLFST